MRFTSLWLVDYLGQGRVSVTSHYECQMERSMLARVKAPFHMRINVCVGRYVSDKIVRL